MNSQPPLPYYLPCTLGIVQLWVCLEEPSGESGKPGRAMEVGSKQLSQQSKPHSPAVSLHFT